MPTKSAENVSNEVAPKWSEILPQLRAWMNEVYPGSQYATFIVNLGPDVPSVVLPVVLPAR